MSERNVEVTRTLKIAPVPGVVVRGRLADVADWLIVFAAVALPWSTSATSILLALWLIAIVPTLGLASVRREVMTAAGGLPVLLWIMGALGMLWADVSWMERLGGLGSFHKLLAIPLLLAQFRGSERWKWAVLGFFASAMLLLVVSWGLALMPGLSWRGKYAVGVPVKDYIMQSGIFALCAFGLLGWAAGLWQKRRTQLALVVISLAAIFLANIMYVAAARTTIAMIAVLLVLLGLRLFRWKGVLGAGLIGVVLAGLVWTSSTYMRERVSRIATDLEHYRENVNTSVGLRLEFWRKSVEFVAQAPLRGHGTGTISMLFEANATPETDPAAITTNPHSQLLAMAIQLGLIGTLTLIAMWIAHLLLFRDSSLIAWFGLMIVSTHVVSSLFNSHLFDFTQGWLYVLAVGVVGGAALQRQPSGETARTER